MYETALATTSGPGICISASKPICLKEETDKCMNNFANVFGSLPASNMPRRGRQWLLQDRSVSSSSGKIEERQSVTTYSWES